MRSPARCRRQIELHISPAAAPAGGEELIDCENNNTYFHAQNKYKYVSKPPEECPLYFSLTGTILQETLEVGVQPESASKSNRTASIVLRAPILSPRLSPFQGFSRCPSGMRPDVLRYNSVDTSAAAWKASYVHRWPLETFSAYAGHDMFTTTLPISLHAFSPVAVRTKCGRSRPIVLVEQLRK